MWGRQDARELKQRFRDDDALKKTPPETLSSHQNCEGAGGTGWGGSWSSLDKPKRPTEPEMLTIAEQPDRKEAGGISWDGSWPGLGKPKHPTEPEMLTFAEQIAAPLNVQLDLAEKMLGQGFDWNPRALGYVYGWTDAFLRVRGWDMADEAIGVPVLFHSFRSLSPGHEGTLLAYMADHLSDGAVQAGIMHGGQQYLDWKNKKVSAPVGLARCFKRT